MWWIEKYRPNLCHWSWPLFMMNWRTAGFVYYDKYRMFYTLFTPIQQWSTPYNLDALLCYTVYIVDGCGNRNLRVAIRTEKFARLQRLIQPMITVKCFLQPHSDFLPCTIRSCDYFLFCKSLVDDCLRKKLCHFCYCFNYCLWDHFW